MRMRSWHNCMGFLALAVAAALTVPVGAERMLHAQDARGSVRGYVRTAQGAAIRSATVVIEAARLQAVTDEAGRYQILNVPAGAQTLAVRRIGFEPATVQVTIAPGRALEQQITLREAIFELPGIVVEGTGRIGQALETQRTSPNLVTVVSEEQLERFPDPQIADALQRLPGVSVQHTFGDASGVALRGLSGRFVNVTVNGQRISSTDIDGRGARLDVMLADAISEVEVHRAITPNMDADAIGGAVNLVTRTPESDVPTGDVRLIGGYNEFTESPQYQGNFRIGQRVGRFGYQFDGSYRDTERSEEMLRYEWQFEDDAPAGSLDLLQLNNYHAERKRYGGGTTLDYQWSDDSYVYLRGMFSRYDDFQLTPEFNLGFGEGEAQPGGILSGVETVGFARIQDRRRSNLNLSGGGRHALGRINLDYSLGYGRGAFDEPRQYRAVFSKEGSDFNVDFSDRISPRFSAANGTDPYGVQGYGISDLRITDDNSLDTDITGGANLEVPFTLGELPVSLQLGGKYRAKERDRDENYKRYEPASDEAEAQIQLTSFLSDFTNPDFFDGEYRLGGIPDPSALKSFYDANPGLFSERVADSRESDFGTYVADEDVAAGYAMLTGHIGRLLLLGGVRYEYTWTGYTGGAVVLDGDGDYVETIIRSQRQRYGDWYPMFHARFQVRDNTNLRFAATRTLARPDYYDLVPWRSVSIEDEEITEGNADLRPTQATSLDLSLEHFYQNTGLVSVSVFRKRLTDFIYEASSDVPFEVAPGEVEEFELTRPENGSRATVQGVELSWQQQLGFLPSFLSGLGLFANYTYIDSEGEILGSDETIQVPDLSPHLLNVALLYDLGGFSGNFSVHHQGGYLATVNSNPAETEYFDRLTRFDVSATQRVTSSVRVFLEVNNLTNSLHQIYFGNRGVPHERKYYGRWVDVGARYNF